MIPKLTESITALLIVKRHMWWSLSTEKQEKHLFDHLYSVNRRTGVHVRPNRMRLLHLTVPLLHNILMHNCHLSTNWLSFWTTLCLQASFLPKFSDETSFFLSCMASFLSFSDFSASAHRRERTVCVWKKLWHLWDV